MSIEANIQQNPTVANNATTEGPITLTVTGIINDLNDGIDRDGIATKYGLTKAEVTELFKHPKLAGLRARKKIPVRFTLVDDTIITAPAVNGVANGTSGTSLTDVTATNLVDPNQMDLMEAIADHQATEQAISN